MTRRSTKFTVILAAAAMIGSTTAYAGEIKGPPPTDNSRDTSGRISNGLSFCSFSGLNDTPLGIPGGDPGGIAQSYGYFLAQYGLFDPSDPAERASFDFPGVGCNPNKGAPARNL
jgi:hypothetical protein